MPENSPLKIQVIVGSTREGRFSEKPARWVAERLAERGDMEVEVVDLRDYDLPFFEQAAPPSLWDGEHPSEEIARWARKVEAADGYVVVTPEYNHGYSAVLKNALDHAFPEWHRKPIAFVSWGNVGGARAVEQLREVAIELEMAPIRHSVHIMPEVLIPGLQSDYDPALFEPNEAKLEALGEDLVWWARVLREGRTREQEPVAA